MERVVAEGKHLRLGRTPYRVKGVTYGHFAPRGDGALFPEPPQVERDLVGMAAQGFTTVRTYSVPPPDLLDTARSLGLRVLVGLRYPDWRMHAEASPRSHRQVRRQLIAKLADIQFEAACVRRAVPRSPWRDRLGPNSQAVAAIDRREIHLPADGVRMRKPGQCARSRGRANVGRIKKLFSPDKAILAVADGGQSAAERPPCRRRKKSGLERTGLRGYALKSVAGGRSHPAH